MESLIDGKGKKSSRIVCVRKENEEITPDWDLVRQHLPLLKSIVSKMSINFPNYTDKEGFYTIGLLALISSSQTYSKCQNATFGTYAGIRIKGALLDELRRMDWLSRANRTQVRAFKQQLNHMEQTLGRPLSEEEICNYLHLTPRQLSRLRNYNKPYVFIPLDLHYKNDNEVSGDHPYSLEEKLADINQKTGRELCEQNEIKSILKQLLKQLPKLTQQILALHYAEGLYLAEIARIFDLSESRVCQIHADAIVKLRKRLSHALKF